jgi:hypothetical protein
MLQGKRRVDALNFEISMTEEDSLDSYVCRVKGMYMNLQANQQAN